MALNYFDIIGPYNFKGHSHHFHNYTQCAMEGEITYDLHDLIKCY